MHKNCIFTFANRIVYISDEHKEYICDPILFDILNISVYHQSCTLKIHPDYS